MADLTHPDWCWMSACEHGRGGPHRSRPEQPVDETGRPVDGQGVAVTAELWQYDGPTVLRLTVEAPGRRVSVDVPASGYGIPLGRLITELVDQAVEVVDFGRPS